MSIKLFIICILTCIFGSLCGYILLQYSFTKNPNGAFVQEIASQVGLSEHEVIGFLPYWLIDKTDKDYFQFITTLTYFGLTVAPDGSVQEYTNPGEKEPGWYALESGKVDEIFSRAKTANVKLSLLVFSGVESDILELVSDPLPHAANLVNAITPFMTKYGFDDLNLDIESVVPTANLSARNNFTIFVKEVRTLMKERNLGTLTIDASPTDLIKSRLIDLPAIEPYVDSIVLMTYDFHYTGSAVTGPVAPVGGAGTEAEFDIETALQKSIEVLPAAKILLGIPLYGYEWESIGNVPRSAVMPGSGLVISNRRAEQVRTDCTDCIIQIDQLGKESYIIYPDEDTALYHQIFYPDKQATLEKIRLANSYGIGGVALWALGYDGNSILDPLREYKHSLK